MILFYLLLRIQSASFNQRNINDEKFLYNEYSAPPPDLNSIFERDTIELNQCTIVAKKTM